MKILEAQSATLTNAEVLSHVAAVDARYAASSPYDYDSRATAKLRNLHTVVAELKGYLTRTAPAGLPGPEITDDDNDGGDVRQDDDASKAHRQRTQDVMRALAPYKLTKAEVLMLFNLRPKDLITLDIIVEEASSRFSEDEQLAILQVISTGGASVNGDAGSGRRRGAGEGEHVEAMQGVKNGG